MRALAVLWFVAACSGRGAGGPANHGGTDPPPVPRQGALSSPGPLAMVHETLDVAGHCADCHVGFSKEIAAVKCLDCHEHQNLRDRIAAGRGFHAAAMVKGKDCKTCHLDHRSRSYDLMGWSSIKGGANGFDHDLSGWKLTGKHAQVLCEQCHIARDRQGLRVFMGTDRQCGACHRDKQPHAFDPKNRALFACDRCHTTGGWAPAKSNLQFDHQDRRDTAYPLGKPHRDVACASCHPNNVFKLGEPRCESCHAAKSPHAGHLFGERPCAWCHSDNERSWKAFTFDHTEHGGPLGEHAKLVATKTLDCYSCHPKTGSKTPVLQTCEGCHAAKSRHGARFSAFGNPARCGTCHRITSWRPRFDHNTTKFPLTFRHASIGCRDCHRGTGPANFERLAGLQSTCMGCHAHTNVHDARYKNEDCLKCHLAPGSANINNGQQQLLDSFHGPKGRFPLVDAHKIVPCADCHTGRSASGQTTFTSLSKECVGCHVDLHKGQNGKTCLGCHDPGTWKPKTTPPPRKTP